jgi:tetratricopeptide (TPR) repeat protein
MASNSNFLAVVAAGVVVLLGVLSSEDRPEQQTSGIHLLSGADALDAGISYKAAGKFAQANISFQHAISSDSSLTNAHWNQAELFYEAGYNAEALTSYNRVIEQDPKNAKAFERRGKLLGLMGDTSAAVEALETAQSMDPELALASEIGLLYFEVGDHQRAYDYLLSALEDDRKNPWTQFIAARCLAKMGDDGAKSVYTALAEQFPNMVSASGLLAEDFTSNDRNSPSMPSWMNQGTNGDSTYFYRFLPVHLQNLAKKVSEEKAFTTNALTASSHQATHEESRKAELGSTTISKLTDHYNTNGFAVVKNAVPWHTVKGLHKYMDSLPEDDGAHPTSPVVSGANR